MILEKMKSIIAERWEIEPDDLDENTSFEDLGADSLDIVELIMILEEEFKIEIADEDAEGLSTIGELVDYIEDRT